MVYTHTGKVSILVPHKRNTFLSKSADFFMSRFGYVDGIDDTGNCTRNYRYTEVSLTCCPACGNNFKFQDRSNDGIAPDGDNKYESILKNALDSHVKNSTCKIKYDKMKINWSIGI